MPSSGVPPATAKQRRSFRWPLLVVAFQLGWMVAFPLCRPGSTLPYPFFVYGGVATLGSLILLWLLLSQSASRSDRITVVSVLAAVAISLGLLLDPSLRLVGIFHFQPIITSALVVTLFLSRRSSPKTQLKWVVGVSVALVALSATLRLKGMSGVLVPEFAWRWQVTGEAEIARLLRTPDSDVAFHLPKEPDRDDWPSFRGPQRNSVVFGVALQENWDLSPPQELWRTPIGPGWSSFSVVGDAAFTQEQSGPDEVISCRHVETGKPIWTHAVEGRFEDSSSGPGPRSTPAYSRNRLYALTATGILVCLQGKTGDVIWQQDLKQQFACEVPHWGFASSPLIVGDLVVVFSGAGKGKSVAAFDVTSGALQWSGGNGMHGYSSPHLVDLHGHPQILMASNVGLESFSPDSGALLWHHEWDIDFLARIVQPWRLPDHSLLLGTGYGNGTRRLKVSLEANLWSIDTIWTSRHLKPYFNDFICHDGFAYGFDGNILACVGLEDGQRRWRRRGFGSGQLMLLERQGLLLVISERGKISLIATDHRQFRLVAQWPGLSGKTWNHPVIRRDLLLIRNGAEAACYRLAIKASQR